MGKHGSYDSAYLFFEVLTNPEGPYRLQPERVQFHPDDYPSDAPLCGTRVLGTPIGHGKLPPQLHRRSRSTGGLPSEICKRRAPNCFLAHCFSK